MNWDQYLYNDGEKPLERLVQGYSHTSIFRTIAFIGDSLSSGEFESRNEEGKPGYHDLYEYSWGQYIARKNGLKAYNFSRGGMTAKVFMESFAEQKGFWDKEKACQAYVIALGVNDLCHKQMPLGSVADVDVNDYRNNKETFLGYYAAIVSRYKEISPEAKFFFVTFPNQSFAEWNKRGAGLREALYDLTKIFDNSYVIDLETYGPLYDVKFTNTYFLYGHMNASGYIITAELIDSYIDYLVRHNQKDFENVPFINTGIKYKPTT